MNVSENWVANVKSQNWIWWLSQKLTQLPESFYMACWVTVNWNSAGWITDIFITRFLPFGIICNKKCTLCHTKIVISWQTDHNKCAAFDGNGLHSYSEGGCILAPHCLFQQMIHGMLTAGWLKDSSKQSAIIIDWISLYSLINQCEQAIIFKNWVNFALCYWTVFN